jgi:general secretion pathway protein C
MSRVGIWIANGLLFVLCCFLVARIVSEVAGAWLEESPDVVLESNGGAVLATRRTWDRRKVILERNLFNVSTLAPSQSEPEPEEDLEATKLPLKLLGTATHSDPSLAWAAVQNLKNRDHLVVRVEDRLLERARVVRIERRRIVLENKGRREELALEEDGAPTGRAARLTGALNTGAGRGRPAARRAATQDLRQRVQELRAAGRVVPRPDRSSSAPGTNPANPRDRASSASGRSPANLFSQARLLPKYEAGQMIGVQVSAIREGSLFEKIGLSNGDTITELNGIQVTNPQESSSVLRELSEADQYTAIVLGSDGEERTLTYTPEE